jgi:hypothetical protein
MGVVEQRHIDAVLEYVFAVGDAIRELGSVPSGHLYGMLMGEMTLERYNGVIGVLKKAGLVTESNHLLTWTGGE